MTVNAVSEAPATQEEPKRERRVLAFKAARVVWLFLSIFEALLALRFVSNLIGDKPVSPFAAVLYGFTGFFRLRMFKF
jgi:hypothetical protein